MTKVRLVLVKALTLVAEGGDIDNVELYRLGLDPQLLDADEQKAWMRLSYWADDDDIRAKDPGYTAFQRERIREALTALSCKGS